MKFTMLRSSLFAMVAGMIICSPAYAVKPMTKADAGKLIPEGEYAHQGNNPKYVGAVPVKKGARKIKVSDLKAARTGTKSAITRSKPTRRPASESKSVVGRKAKKNPKAIKVKTLSATRKKNSTRSPASRAPKVRTKKLNSTPRKGPVNSQSSGEVRVPDAFDMHSGTNPIRGT